MRTVLPFSPNPLHPLQWVASLSHSIGVKSRMNAKGSRMLALVSRTMGKAAMKYSDLPVRYPISTISTRDQDSMVVPRATVLSGGCSSNTWLMSLTETRYTRPIRRDAQRRSNFAEAEHRSTDGVAPGRPYRTPRNSISERRFQFSSLVHRIEYTEALFGPVGMLCSVPVDAVDLPSQR